MNPKLIAPVLVLFVALAGIGIATDGFGQLATTEGNVEGAVYYDGEVIGEAGIGSGSQGEIEFDSYQFEEPPVIVSTPRDKITEIAVKETSDGFSYYACGYKDYGGCNNPSVEFSWVAISQNKAEQIDSISVGKNEFPDTNDESQKTVDTGLDDPLVFANQRFDNGINNNKITNVKVVSRTETRVESCYLQYGGCDNYEVGGNQQFGWIAVENGQSEDLFKSVLNENSKDEGRTQTISHSITGDIVPVVELQTQKGGQEPLYAFYQSITDSKLEFGFCEQDDYGGCDSHASENIGVALFTVHADSDQDQVIDSNDECPETGDQGLGLRDNGCPILDTDGDGVYDHNDQCEETGDQGLGLKDNGCPKEDSDGDGVLDSNDKCPEVAGSKENGCPTVIEKVQYKFSSVIDSVLGFLPV